MTNYDGLEEAAAHAPPFSVARASGFPKALDGHWENLGFQVLPIRLRISWLIPHAHRITQKFWQLPYAESTKPDYCKIKMKNVLDDYWAGLCEESGNMFWARVKFEG